MKPAAGYMVYLLIDPRDLSPFYAGMTCRPYARWKSHTRDSFGSAAYPRLKVLHELGLKCRVRIIAANLSRVDAFALEKQTITKHKPTLLNGKSGPPAPKADAA